MLVVFKFVFTHSKLCKVVENITKRLGDDQDNCTESVESKRKEFLSIFGEQKKIQ